MQRCWELAALPAMIACQRLLFQLSEGKHLLQLAGAQRCTQVWDQIWVWARAWNKFFACIVGLLCVFCDETCERHFHRHASYTAASARQVTSCCSFRRIISQCFLLPAQLETLPGNLYAQLFSVIVSGRVCNVHPRPNRRNHIEDGWVVLVASLIGHFSCRRSSSSSLLEMLLGGLMLSWLAVDFKLEAP